MHDHGYTADPPPDERPGGTDYGDSLGDFAVWEHEMYVWASIPLAYRHAIPSMALGD